MKSVSFVFVISPLFSWSIFAQLDLETTRALIDAISTFAGGVLLVSHDQHLLTSVCKELLVVENGKVEVLKGSMNNTDAFNAYKKAVILGRR